MAGTTASSAPHAPAADEPSRRGRNGEPSRPERLLVNEIFYSIQGESTYAGLPCVLVRLTGCQMRCRWCDTAYSFYQGQWMSLEEILEAVARHGCRLVEVTGGEPLLQPAAPVLLERLCDEGYEVLLETGGGLPIEGIDPRIRRIVDVKCPQSGEAANNRWENLDQLRSGDQLKFVLAGREDYEWARELVRGRGLDARCPVLFSPVHGELELGELAGWVLEDRLAVRVQTQLHKLIWGADARGV